MKQLWDIYKKHREGIDYLFWGGIAFLLSMFLFWLFAGKWGWPEVFANTVNWIICVIFTFFTNKLFVFRSKTHSSAELAKEFTSFVAARIFTLILEDIIIWIGCSKMGYDEGLGQMVVKLVGQFVVIVTNYILSKLWIFRKPKEKTEVKDENAEGEK